jgi:cation diffusion facilitator CzcD-associated flavoprotein CzcO
MRHDHCEVAIVGAGPYGLATAAHLRGAKVTAAVFGDPMAFWRKNMPSGMKLRSPWRASTIGDPDNAHTLDVFARENGIAKVENLPLTEFVRYGEWFQRRAVPDVDRRLVKTVAAGPRGFRLTLSDDTTVESRRVVVAMGLHNQAYQPAVFDNVPAALVSHSSAVVKPADFAGRKVAVVGRGQSAVESAVLLSEAGAEVDLIARGDIHWIGHELGDVQGDPLWWLHGILSAPSGIGPFPYNWMADVPSILYALPPEARLKLADRTLRAAASAWLKKRAGKVRFNFGRTIMGAAAAGDGIELHLDTGKAAYEHAVLATGYRTDVAKMAILSAELLSQVAHRANYPVLSMGFETSVPGLHIVGSPAVGSFGPLPRFVAGSGYAARGVTRAVVAAAARSPARAAPRAAMQPQQ